MKRVIAEYRCYRCGTEIKGTTKFLAHIREHKKEDRRQEKAALKHKR